MKRYIPITESYKGHHEAPDSGTGDPIYNVSQKIYPEDFYSYDGARLYGSGLPKMDQFSVSIVQSLRNKPGARVTVYRAVPKLKSNSEKIKDYENQKRTILKTGRMPKKFDADFKPSGNSKVSSEYYSYISDRIENLKNSPEIPQKEEKLKINPGDWVTINRDYAKFHGDSWLKNGYTILSKIVRADELFTSGDSVQEWGYYPRSK